MAALLKKIGITQRIAKLAFKQKWVVYTKRPFTSPKTVVAYLGSYNMGTPN